MILLIFYFIFAIYMCNSLSNLHFQCLQVRDFVAEQMSLRGIEFHTEELPQAILKSADGSLSLKTSKGTVEGFSHIMFATGRRPNTKVDFCTFVVDFYLVYPFSFVDLPIKAMLGVCFHFVLFMSTDGIAFHNLL